MSLPPENEEFDPYRVWLGIPKAEQPAHYYRLLGITLFERDPLVIQEAADRQLAHLRTKQIGSRMALAQKLLQHVASAAACLLNAESKARYDLHLRNSQPTPTAKPLPQATAPRQAVLIAQALPLPQAAPLPAAKPDPQPTPVTPAVATPTPAPPATAATPAFVTVNSSPRAPSSTSRKRDAESMNPLVPIAISGALGVALVVVVMLVLSNNGFFESEKPGSLSGVPGPAVADKPPPRSPAAKNEPKVKPPLATAIATDVPTTSFTPPVTAPVAPAKPPPADPFAPESATKPVKPSRTPPTNPPAAIPKTSAAALVTPPNDAGALVAADAMREGVEFVEKLCAHLDQEFRVPSNRTLAAKHRTLMQQILAGETALGPIPADDGQLAAYRKELFIKLVKPVDQEFFDLGGDPVLSAPLLTVICMPTRVHSPTAVGGVMRVNGEDIFPAELGRFADRVQAGALSAGDDVTYDRLCFLAALARALQFAYLRGNAEQFHSCVLLTAVGIDCTGAVSETEVVKPFHAALDDLCLAAGLMNSGVDIQVDPRRSFRNATSQFTRQANGDWIETKPAGTVVYREVKRTPTLIDLVLPDNADQFPRVQLTLLWSVVTVRTEPNSTRLRDDFSVGKWDVPKSDRLLSPRPNIRLPGTPLPVPRNPQNPLAGGNNPAQPNPGQPNPGQPNPGRPNPGRPNPAQPQRPGIKPAVVPGALAGKKLWRHLAGFVAVDADGVWRELAPSGDYFTLTFIGPKDDALEFQRGNSNTRLRLYDNRCETSASSSAPFVEAYKGTWATPLEEIELESAQATSLRKTCETYEDALTRARKVLLDKFNAALVSARKRTGKAEDRLALISGLQGEQDRFEREGLIPWSTPMRTAASDYLTAVQRARQIAETAFDRAIDHFIKQEQGDTANSVLVLKQKTLAPILVAKLIPRGGGAIPRDLPLDEVDRMLRDRRGVVYRLWSNGQLNEVTGTSKWSTENGGLVLNIVRSNSAAKDRLTLSDKGDEFTAQSSNGTTYSGAFGGALEPHERRPEVDFEAKVK